VIPLIRARIGSNERGASLILALAFLSLFGVAIATLLSFADTSIRTTVAVRSQRGTVFAASAAAQTAINSIRKTPSMGAYKGPCTVPSVGDNDVTPTVTCAGQVGSGATTTGTPVTAPGNAVTTLGMGSWDGSWFGTFDGSAIAIVGSVSTNAGVLALSSNLNVTGSVSAGFCFGTVNVRGSGNTKNCSATTAIADPGVTDTSWGLPVNSPPAAGTDPSCVTGTATYSPGTFSDPTALNNCAKVILQPGLYYFNFSAANPTWNVKRTVIGGTLTAAGSSCDSTRPGVELVFGGPSQVVVGNGASFSVCASPSATSQQIAIYGVGHATTASPATATSSDFSTPNNALIYDGNVATGNVSTSSSPSITLQGFANSIPPGSTIASAVLRVRHFEGGDQPDSVVPSVVATPGGESAQPATSLPACPPDSSGVCDAAIDMTGFLTTPAAIAGLSVAYSATIGGSTATTNLDAMALDVVYAPSGWTPQNTCSFSCLSCGNARCPVITMSQSGQNPAAAALVVTGTVYVPLTDVSVFTQRNATLALSRGIVARATYLTVPGLGSPLTITSTGPPGPPANRTVLFKVMVAGVIKLQTLVGFDDSVPNNPGATVTVKSWSVDR
jgi:hypothetical protein